MKLKFFRDKTYLSFEKFQSNGFCFFSEENSFCSIIFLVSNYTVHAEHLKPGFDPKEYYEMLLLSDQQADSPAFKIPDNYTLVYRSPVVGLLNRWDFFLRNDSVAVISIRGTTGAPVSWIENFYAAMVPAEGVLKINDSSEFHYKLADEKDAYVHVGWLTGLAALMPTMKEQIMKYYGKGVKQFIIMGHSQGGAIAFLACSYFHYAADMPRDIVFKTYCSAAPKPGNLYYAYDFDYINQGGWAYRVVNSVDWVPEVPFSVQTASDFNPVNPFVNAKAALKKQKKLLLRWYTTSAYNKMDSRTRKATKTFKKYLGNTMEKVVKQTLPQLQPPPYVLCNNYMVAGSPIILEPHDDYFEKFKYNGKNVFLNHFFAPYIYLTKEQFGLK